MLASIQPATLLLHLLGICLFSAEAATYHLAPSGNDNAAGELSTPLRTLERAVVKAAAGDSIIVSSGVYTCAATITLNKNGLKDQPICIIGSSVNRPVFDFSSMAVLGSNQGLLLSGRYWYIRGIIIKGAGDNGLLIQGGSNNTIEFCDFLENRDTGCQLKGGAANNRIINCDSYNNRDPDEGDADGFAPKMDVGSGNIFIGCRAWQNSDDGWDGYLRGTDNVTTRLENCWCFNNGYRKDGSASVGNGNGFKMGGSDNKALKHNFTLVRCLAFGNRVKGFDQNNNRGSMTLYNCTAFSNGTNYSVDGSSSTLVIKNSIACGSGTNRLTGGMQAANNFSAEKSQFFSTDPADARAPRDTNGTLPDISFMHLAENSNLIDGGEMIEGVTYSGKKPDLGCFENEDPVSSLEPGIHRSVTSVIHGQIKNQIGYYTLSGRRIGGTILPDNLRSGVYIRHGNCTAHSALLKNDAGTDHEWRRNGKGK